MKKQFLTGVIILIAGIPLRAIAWTGHVNIPNPSRWNDLGDIIIGLLNYFLDVLAVLAFVALVYSGIMYITAGGAQDKAEAAKKNITWAIIGIAIVLLSIALLNWINDIIANGS